MENPTFLKALTTLILWLKSRVSPPLFKTHIQNITIKTYVHSLFRRSICALKLYSGPKDDEAGVEGFSSAFKDLGRFIFEVGCELAVACQPFGASEVRPAAKFLNIYYSSVPSERFLHVAAPIDQHVEHSQSSPSTLLPTESRRRPDRRKRPRGQLVWLAP